MLMLIFFFFCFSACLFFVFLGKEEDLANFLIAVSEWPGACDYNQIKIVA